MSGIVEFLGWFGAVTVLLGYLLFSTGKLPNGPVYQLFNLVGGLSVAINVAAHHAVPSTIVNGIWAIVAMVVLVRMARARRAAGRTAPAPGARPTQESVAHVEPPTTTAVLPVIGPALRAHDEQPAPTTAGTAPTATTPTTGSIPLVESVPVITAALALALVHAAQDHTAAAPATGPGADDRPEARDRADAAVPTGAEHRTATPAEAAHHTPTS